MQNAVFRLAEVSNLIPAPLAVVIPLEGVGPVTPESPPYVASGLGAGVRLFHWSTTNKNPQMTSAVR